MMMRRRIGSWSGVKSKKVQWEVMRVRMRWTSMRSVSMRVRERVDLRSLGQGVVGDIGSHRFKAVRVTDDQLNIRCD